MAGSQILEGEHVGDVQHQLLTLKPELCPFKKPSDRLACSQAA